jgi:cyclopropane fatty-acyl-phospholipid synthase-like methyltransferase
LERSFHDGHFFELHKDLPREGPGDAASTLKAFRLMENLPAHPRLLDVGCGPGMQTIELAQHMDGTILAVDNHQPFLDELKKRANRAGVADRITIRNESMFDLNFEKNSFDAIWSEGAIYIIGFEKGLRKVRPFLKPGGYVAMTEVSWLKPNPPVEIRNFWEDGYPGMNSLEANLASLVNAGYREVGHFTLPDSSWWDDYFHPLEKRIEMLSEKYADDPEAQLLLKENRREIELFSKYSDWYGYVFYVMQAV